MCGRYFFNKEDYQELMDTDIIKSSGFDGGEIFPSSSAPVLDQEMNLLIPSWGMAWPSGGGLLLHARAETLEVKPSFKHAFITGRVLIPTSGFYEWLHIDGKSQRGKKYFFYLENNPRLYLSGLLLSNAEGKNSFVIITREANMSMVDIHDRNPLVLAADEAKSWLTDHAFAQYVLKRPQVLLAREFQGV